MRRSPKQVGTEAETKVQRYLIRWFPGVKRLAPAGRGDLGDLGGVPFLTLQVKGGHKMELATWVDQATAQSERAGTPHCAVIHRRWGQAPGRWYVTTPLEVFAPLYAQYVSYEEALREEA